MAGFMRLMVWRERMALRFDEESGEPRFVPESEAHGYADLPEEIAAERDGYAEPNIGGEGSMAYWAHYSAPGYMDRTDTSGPWPTALEAGCAAWDMFGDVDNDAEELIAVLANLGCDPDDVRSFTGLTRPV